MKIIPFQPHGDCDPKADSLSGESLEEVIYLHENPWVSANAKAIEPAQYVAGGFEIKNIPLFRSHKNFHQVASLAAIVTEESFMSKKAPINNNQPLERA